jgi:DNA-binding transcriptional LysR family regulator
VTSWLGLDVRHLLALVAVAEEGTFSGAAQRLGYTQSAISQRVGALERIVGVTLFERPGGPRRLRHTAEGRALVGHARAVIAQLRDAEAELRALSFGEQGVLRVGTVQSVGARVLPELLRRFRAEQPNVEVQLRESYNPNELLPLMLDGALDLTFAPLPVPDGPFSSRVVFHDPFVLVAPADSPEAALATISIEEVARLPLINHRSSWCRATLAELFTGASPAPRFVFESNDNSTIQGLVGGGVAYWCDGLLSVDPSDSATAVIPINPPVEPRRIAAVWAAGRHLPAALAPFINTAAAVCTELTGAPA